MVVVWQNWECERHVLLCLPYDSERLVSSLDECGPISIILGLISRAVTDWPLTDWAMRFSKQWCVSPEQKSALDVVGAVLALLLFGTDGSGCYFHRTVLRWNFAATLGSLEDRAFAGVEGSFSGVTDSGAFSRPLWEARQANYGDTSRMETSIQPSRCWTETRSFEKRWTRIVSTATRGASPRLFT